MTAGRPLIPYDPELGDFICDQYASGPVSLKTILERAVKEFGDSRVPSIPIVFRWIREVPEFLNNYNLAKESQADLLFEDTLDIADDASKDWETRKHFAGDDESPQVNGEAIARSKLRIDTRKWIAAHLRPKKYGDKIGLDQTVSVSPELGALMDRIAGQGKRLTPAQDDDTDGGDA